MNEFKVLKNVDLSVYVSAVNDIVRGFFDEDNNYTPHIGRANAVGVFFNYFVDEESINQYFGESDDQIDSGVLLKGEKCMSAYNVALNDNNKYQLDFPNAYADALDIVNTRKSSLRYSLEVVTRAIEGLLERFSGVLNEDNLDKIAGIFEQVKNEDFDTDKLIKAYEKSGRIKEIAKG